MGLFVEYLGKRTMDPFSQIAFRINIDFLGAENLLRFAIDHILETRLPFDMGIQGATKTCCANRECCALWAREGQLLAVSRTSCGQIAFPKAATQK
jgi:hypothetical protein